MTRHNMLYCGWFEISGPCSSSGGGPRRPAAPRHNFLGRGGLGDRAPGPAGGGFPARGPPPPPPLGHADVERLSGAYDVREREHRLLERRHVVEPMRLVEVDVVG